MRCAVGMSTDHEQEPDVAALRAAAEAVLRANWRGDHTVPAGGLYPHQWSWDSAFIALGLRHASPERARQELASLLDAQWADGRVPQIVFDVGRDDDYSPGDAFWRSATLPGAPSVPTAGLVQPPVHAWAVLAVHRSDPDGSRREGFLERAHPRLVAWHAYLQTRRDRGGRGLASIVHPWESGMDDSPLWDAALAAVDLPQAGPAEPPPRPDLRHAAPSERPTSAQYATYLALAGRYRDVGCDDDDEGPFLLEDPAFNALWAVSELALARIADELGLRPAPHEARAAALTAALEALWLPELGTFTARDVRTGALVPHATVSGLVPLLLPGLPRAQSLLEVLRGPRFGLGRVLMVPSADLTAPGFDPVRYWRGPSWWCTTWLVLQGLRLHGEHEAADGLAAQACRLAAEHGFPEYVDPFTGAPHGTRAFSWTAALVLDLAGPGGSALP